MALIPSDAKPRSSGFFYRLSNIINTVYEIFITMPDGPTEQLITKDYMEKIMVAYRYDRIDREGGSTVEINLLYGDRPIGFKLYTIHDGTLYIKIDHGIWIWYEGFNILGYSPE